MWERKTLIVRKLEINDEESQAKEWNAFWIIVTNEKEKTYDRVWESHQNLPTHQCKV